MISSVTQFGLYNGAALPNTVEGLVRAQALSGKRPLTLTAGRGAAGLSGREWRLGGVMLRVRVAGVDVSQGNVDFVPAQEQ